MRPFEKKGGRVVVETKNMWLWKSMCHNMYSYIVKTCRWWIILSLSMDLNVLQVHKSRSQRKSTWWIQKFVDNIFISSLSNGWHCFFTRCYVSCTGYGWVNREAILADKDFFLQIWFFSRFLGENTIKFEETLQTFKIRETSKNGSLKLCTGMSCWYLVNGI